MATTVTRPRVNSAAVATAAARLDRIVFWGRATVYAGFVYYRVTSAAAEALNKYQTELRNQQRAVGFPLGRQLGNGQRIGN